MTTSLEKGGIVFKGGRYSRKYGRLYLTTIGGRWYFDRAFCLQRLTNQSLYNKILLLQKFNDIGGKGLKQKR